MNKIWRAAPPTPRWLFLVSLAAPLFLSAFFPLEVRGLATLIVAGLVPGALLVYRLAAQSEAPPPWWEFWLYAVGAGYAVLVVAMLLLSYLPGPLGGWQLLVASYALNLVLLGLIWQRARRPQQPTATTPGQSRLPARGVVRWSAAGALVLLLLASYFRLGSLGYAEFLTDEARVVLRAAAVLQGYEDVLFIHRKGPVEILLPAAEFALAGQMNEAAARLPFATASITAVFAVWLLGWRIFGGLAGWAAAFLLVFDGYLVGFAHFAQFQSIVLLTSVLTLLVLHRLTQTPAAIMPHFTLAALFLATGLLSHYDTLLVCLPAATLLAHLLWQARASLRRVVRDLAPGCLLGVGLLALFYAPFIADPHFQATYSYIVDRRIGGDAFPYNNLLDILRRSSVYNSTYYVGALAILLWAGLGISYRRGWAGRAGRVAAGVAMVVAATTVAAALLRPDLLRLGVTDLTVLAAVLLLAPLWVAPRLDAGWRMVWIWFSTGVMAAFFLVAFPRTHVYIFAVPAALLAGMVIATAQSILASAFGLRPARVAGGVVAVAAALLFGGYLHSYFIATDREVLRTWPEDHPARYWQPAAINTIDAVYGFPLANGWKTVGMLFAQGTLQGSYESNQRDNLISYWYTRGAERCFSTAEHYFVIDNLEPWAESPAVARTRVEDYGFAPWGFVTVNGEPRLEILQMGAAPERVTAPRFALESSAAAFDALATPDLPLDYPIVEPPMAHKLDADFGGEIQLEGYAIENADALTPGGVIQLRLFWRAQQPLSRSYTVFNQAYYGDGVMVAQQDSLPVCDRKPTTEWDPGELIVDSRTIPIAPDAPAGDYPLYVGLYDAQTSARLSVLDANGAPVDDKVHVTDIHIAAP